MNAPAAEPIPVATSDRPVLSVSLAALAANYRTLQDAASGAETAAVVKADGYGLGASAAAAKLKAIGCKTFFVATYDEGFTVRTIVGAGPRIFVLNGLPPDSAAAFIANGLTPVLNTLLELRDWAAHGGRRSCAVHVDTGMNRAGLAGADLDAFAGDSALRNQLDIALILSHLACSDEPGHPQNRRQLESFKAALARLPAAPASLAASAGIFMGADYRFDVVRPGVALYGGNPFAAKANPMRAVGSLTAQVIGVRTVPAGTGVGYGATRITQRETRLAVCNIGYADGIPRALSNKGVAFIGDTPCPYAGRVSMDLLTIDVTAAPDVTIGTPVEIIGPHISVEDMAAAAGTANYEILTGLGQRFARVTTDSHWTRIV